MTPLSYYGGKNLIAGWIVSKFPKSYSKMTYIEPFFGGGAVYFYKKPSKLEIINDIDKNLILFYKILKTEYQKLYKRLNENLITEDVFLKSLEILKNPKNYSDFDRAFAYFIRNRTSFMGRRQIFGTNHRDVIIIKNILLNLKIFSNRLQKTAILNRSAFSVITNSYENKTDVFFYLDPPYPNTDQKFYTGQKFTQTTFENLMYVLRQSKHKFLLSCYEKNIPNNIPKNWTIFYKKTNIQTKFKTVKCTDRVECLIRNF